MSQQHILVVDDDKDIRTLIAEYLERNGYRVSTLPDGRELARTLEERAVDLLVLDLMMPGPDGLALCRDLRAKSRLPVLILTARGEDVDRIVGLELGADDYLAKPFNSRELMARVRAILRRAVASEDAVRIEIGDVTLDPGSRQAWRAGQPLSLTMAEFGLLETFLRNCGEVLSRERLAEQVLGRALSAFDRSIDVHVSNLRKRLGDAPAAREHIRAVRGEGYV